jgi:hypothetical protein
MSEPVVDARSLLGDRINCDDEAAIERGWVITVGQTVSGQIDPYRDDINWFVIVLEAGTAYSFVMGTANFRYRKVDIYDADGRLVAVEND